jgi:serpin B
MNEAVGRTYPRRLRVTALATGMLAVVLATLSGCAGTRTTNPFVPAGAELVKSNAVRDEQPTLSSEAAASLSAGNQAFALSLYRELAADRGNLFFSPYSISVALAMTYAGAAGDTEREMRDTLHFDLDQPELHTAFDVTSRTLESRAQQIASSALGADSKAAEGFRLSIVNQAWGQKGYAFVDTYLDTLAQHYGAGLFLVDFAGRPQPSRRLINTWVADQTAQHILELLPEPAIDSRTRLVLTNAVYFKASWETAFEPGDTRDGPFQAPAGERNVKMMHATLPLRYAHAANYQALELPYASDDLCMLIVLPEPGQLDAVSGRFDPVFLNEMLAQLSPASVMLSMPRWSFSSDLQLKSALSTLGMPAAFTPDADFSRLARSSELSISDVYHEAFVAVDEQGTEAAAATAVVIKTKGSIEEVTVALDHPFLFVIYDEPTRQLLFVGQLVDPSQP